MACVFTERNLVFDSQRQVWRWSSALLRRGWESEVWQPFDIQIGLDQFVLHDQLSRKLTLDIIGEMTERRPAVLLALALRSPEIDLSYIRRRYSKNVRMDEIAKSTAAREDRFGEDWIRDGFHPTSLVTEWTRLYIPLKAALLDCFLEKTERLQVEIDALAVQSIENMNAIEAGLLMPGERRAPREILSALTRLRLRNAYEQGDDDDLANMIGLLSDVLTPAVKKHVLESGYSAEDVVLDFLFHDARHSRDGLFCGPKTPRPRLP